jgi:hypothetical protein
MEIKKVTYKEVHKEFSKLKPDLLDEYATYYGCFIKDELVGIVSYLEHPAVIYLCHAYVKEDHREKGIYKLLWNYRDAKIKEFLAFFLFDNRLWMCSIKYLVETAWSNST